MIGHGDIGWRAVCDDLAAVKQDDVVATRQRVQLVCRHDDCAAFIAQQSEDAMLQQVRAHLQTERISQLILCILVHAALNSEQLFFQTKSFAG